MSKPCKRCGDETAPDVERLEARIATLTEALREARAALGRAAAAFPAGPDYAAVVRAGRRIQEALNGD